MCATFWTNLDKWVTIIIVFLSEKKISIECTKGKILLTPFSSHKILNQSIWHPGDVYKQFWLVFVMLNKDATPTSNFQPIRLLDLGFW